LLDRVGGSTGQLQYNNAGVLDGVVSTYSPATQFLHVSGTFGVQKGTWLPPGSNNAFFVLRNSDLFAASASFSGDGGGFYCKATAGSLFWLGSSGPTMNLSGNLPITTISGTTYTITEADRGRILRFTSNSPITLTLAAVSDGFVALVVKTGSGTLTLSGYAALLSVDDLNQIADVNGEVKITHQTGNTWFASGNLA
jgi:hypothetical protein